MTGLYLFVLLLLSTENHCSAWCLSTVASSLRSAGREKTRGDGLFKTRQARPWTQMNMQPGRDHIHDNNDKGHNIVQLSSNPLMFTIDNFLDPKLCATATTTPQKLNEVGALLQHEIAVRLFQNQTSPMDGMRYNTAIYEPATENIHNGIDDDKEGENIPLPSPLSVFPDGLHMDTNNECIFRHVTCILYLNDVTFGGATIFPLAEIMGSTEGDDALSNNNDNKSAAAAARQSQQVEASRRLLKESIGHTRSCGTVRRSGEKRQADGVLLEYFAGDTGIQVQPQAGRLLIFFSRTNDGKEDPRAWHGGERLHAKGAGLEKKILTLFKQVDYGSVYPSEAQTTFEAFLAPQIDKQRRWLVTESSTMN